MFQIVIISASIVAGSLFDPIARYPAFVPHLPSPLFAHR